jgi:DASS family divalent anion:Na+ symporter
MMLPVPAGLAADAWKLFAIYVGAILGLMFRPFPEPVVLLAAISISSVMLNNISIILGGYSDSVTWLVFAAFMVGTAFVETGLGRRIAYVLIGRLGRSSLGLGYVAAFTDLALSPATPSNTARTGGIVYPIIQSIAVTLESEPGPTSRRIGAYLTLTLYQVCLTTGYIFMTALSPNLLMVSFAASILKVQVDWMMWFKAAVIPGMLILLLIPWVVHKLYPPELTTIDNKTLAADGLAELGPMSTREKALAVLFVLAVLGWATGTITKLNATAVAICFLSAALIAGVVNWKSLVRSEGAWSILVWYGGIIGLSNGLAKAKFFEWMAKLLASNLSFEGYHSITILGGLLFFSLIIRYFFASMAAYVTTMIPVFFTIGLVAQVPPLPLFFLITFSAAYGSLLTHYGGAAGAVLFAPGYVDHVTWWKIGAVIVAISYIVHMGIGLPYWKIIGLW